jgi:hypothetical protein
MSGADRARRDIHASTLVSLILGGAVLAVVLSASLEWPLAIFLCIVALLPWLYALATAGRVGRAAARETKDEAAGIASTVREYTLLTPLPLFGLLLARRVFRGEVGGGTRTVNGVTSSIPVYRVGSLGTALGLRMVCFNLLFMAAYASPIIRGVINQ